MEERNIFGYFGKRNHGDQEVGGLEYKKLSLKTDL